MNLKISPQLLCNALPVIVPIQIGYAQLMSARRGFSVLPICFYVVATGRYQRKAPRHCCREVVARHCIYEQRRFPHGAARAVAIVGAVQNLEVGGIPPMGHDRSQSR